MEKLILAIIYLTCGMVFSYAMAKEYSSFILAGSLLIAMLTFFYDLIQ